jgi:magnesium-transporting ATPase (P-type)
MLWVNLIMDTFAALALATEPPSDAVLDRAPVKTDEYIVNTDMWRNIMGQSVYQIVWLCIILFAGEDIFDVPNGREEQHWDTVNGQHFTIFFNAFVFMQVFNEINSRKLKASELNVFANFFNNSIFFLVVVFTIIVQIVLV